MNESANIYLGPVPDVGKRLRHESSLASRHADAACLRKLRTASAHCICMDDDKTRPRRPDSSKVLVGLLIAMAFAVAGVGLYALYYNSTVNAVPHPVTLPR